VLYRVAASSRIHVLNLFIDGRLVDAVPFSVYPSTVDIGKAKAGTTVRSTIYLRGWGDALKAIPRAVVLRPGDKRDFVVGSDFKPAPNLDRKMRIAVKIPIKATPGKFRARAWFTCKGFAPVVITINGRIVLLRKKQLTGKNAVGTME
jgi:hypothetical protein